MNEFRKQWEELKKSKKYTTSLDMYIGDLFNGRHGDSWYVGQAKSFTDSEIDEIKRKKGSRAEYIEEYNDSPRRFVNLISPEGKIEQITWGEYLRRNKRK